MAIADRSRLDLFLPVPCPQSSAKGTVSRSPCRHISTYISYRITHIMFLSFLQMHYYYHHHHDQPPSIICACILVLIQSHFFPLLHDQSSRHSTSSKGAIPTLRRRILDPSPGYSQTIQHGRRPQCPLVTINN
jgi:hypothetical protein